MVAIPRPGFRYDEPSVIGRQIVKAADDVEERTIIGVYSQAEVDNAIQASGLENVSDITGGALVHTGDGVTQGTLQAGTVKSDGNLTLTSASATLGVIVTKKLSVKTANSYAFAVQSNTGSTKFRVDTSDSSVISYAPLWVATLVDPTAVKVTTDGTTLGTLQAATISTTGIAFRSGSSDPTTSDLSDGYKTTWRNTTSGEIRDFVNDGGTILKSAAYVVA